MLKTVLYLDKQTVSDGVLYHIICWSAYHTTLSDRATVGVRQNTRWNFDERQFLMRSIIIHYL